MVMKLPEATDSIKGLVGTGDQTFGGKKVWVHPGGDSVKSVRYAGVFTVLADNTTVNEDLNLTTLFGISATTIVWGMVSIGSSNVNSGANTRASLFYTWSAEVGTASSINSGAFGPSGSGSWVVAPSLAWESTQTLRITARLASGGGINNTTVKYVLDLHYT